MWVELWTILFYEKEEKTEAVLSKKKKGRGLVFPKRRQKKGRVIERSMQLRVSLCSAEDRVLAG